MHERIEAAFTEWQGQHPTQSLIVDSAVRRAFEAGFQAGEKSLWERFGNPKYGQIKWNEISK